MMETLAVKGLTHWNPIFSSHQSVQLKLELVSKRCQENSQSFKIIQANKTSTKQSKNGTNLQNSAYECQTIWGKMSNI